MLKCGGTQREIHIFLIRVFVFMILSIFFFSLFLLLLLQQRCCSCHYLYRKKNGALNRWNQQWLYFYSSIMSCHGFECVSISFMLNNTMRAKNCTHTHKYKRPNECESCSPFAMWISWVMAFLLTSKRSLDNNFKLKAIEWKRHKTH